MFSYILAIICGFIILGLDQISKYFVVNNLQYNVSTDFIPGILKFRYRVNTGGAFSVFEDHTWLILSLSAILMIVCFALLIKLGRNNKFVFWAVSFVIFGGLGNMIDRVFRAGEVVDFLEFDFWETFPVFNIADCAIVLGAFLLIFYFIYDSIKDVKSRKRVPYQDNNE